MPSAEVMPLVNPWAQAVVHAGHNSGGWGILRGMGFFCRQSSRPELCDERSAHFLCQPRQPYSMSM